MNTNAPIRGHGYLKDKRRRPTCECHGRLMSWKGDPLHRDGGYWHCAIEERKRDKAKQAERRRSKVRTCAMCGASFTRSEQSGWKYCSDECATDKIRAKYKSLNTSKSPEIVYLVQAETGGPVKMGKSTEEGFGRRLGLLQAGNPERLVMVAKVAGGHKLERQIARANDDLLIRGEWYDEQLLARLLSADSPTGFVRVLS